MLDNCFSFVLNANDFFAFNCADSIFVDSDDTEWILPIVEKYGQSGVDAVMSYMRHVLPLEKYLTPKFNEAYQDIVRLNPTIYSS